MDRYEPSAESLIRLIDEDLQRFLSHTRAELPAGDVMIDEVTRLIASGGKRLRPSFCYWGFRAAGAAHGPEIVRASSSLELLHTFAIVHDDIMDVSDERRGQPTTFAVHGVNIALLVGDLALVLADAAFMSSGLPSDRVAAAFGCYSRMRQEVIVGQFLDIEAARRAEISVDEAREIAVLKSGRYSIQEPLAIGAALAGASDAFMVELVSFVGPLGEAFQLRDDLLGSFGERSNVGKPVDSDIREGKRHVLFAEAVRSLSGADREFFLGRWGRGSALTEDEVETLRSLLVSSGARAATEALLDALRAEALGVLEKMDVPDDARRALGELARRATERDL